MRGTVPLPWYIYYIILVWAQARGPSQILPGNNGTYNTVYQTFAQA